MPDSSGSWEDHRIDEEDAFLLGTADDSDVGSSEEGSRRTKTMTKSKFVALNLTGSSHLRCRQLTSPVIFRTTTISNQILRIDG